MEKLKQVIEEIKAGKMIIVTDDKRRENEGDLVLAAEFANADNVNFMIKKTGGVVCLSLSSELTGQLGLTMMVNDNSSRYATPFTVSIDARKGISTGISAADRAHTIQLASKEGVVANDFVSPGHVFPLRAKKYGVLQREGHTEAAVDLMNLAGLKPAAVISELMNEDGSMMKGDEVEKFAQEFSIPIISVAEIKQYRLQTEMHIEELSKARLPTEYGCFEMSVLRNLVKDEEYIVLKTTNLEGLSQPLLRIHSQCLTGDVFSSARCDCGWQLQESLKRISAEGGVLIYLAQEGRGIGLANKIRAYALQEGGFDTVSANEALGFDADLRNYDYCGQILKFFGIYSVRLLTNNPKKIQALQKQGIQVAREALLACLNAENHYYLFTKQQKLEHLYQLEPMDNA